MTSKYLRFVTWNIRGIKTPLEKVTKVLESLNNLRADIAFIQETRVGPKCHQILTRVNDWKVYFTVHLSSSKGAAILIKNNEHFKYICHDEDCSGGYIVLFCHLYGELYTLVNVYNHKADELVLGRLKEYLRETAEGVLVIGGDFNTVLHPCFDRSPPAPRPSPLRAILEDFIVSLKLRDIWSYLHVAEEGFTRHQNESHSRLDMFFMHKDRVGRVDKITIEHNDISDHDPVVLNLKTEEQQQSEYRPPKVAKFETCNRIADKIPGKISGAEILSAIKTLDDLEDQRPDQRQVSYYKSKQCPLTETLKIEYNRMLKTNRISNAFKQYHLSGDRHIFNVEYVIFTQILAKRLSAYVLPWSEKRQEKQKSKKEILIKKKQKANLDKFLTVMLQQGPKEIDHSFLMTPLKQIYENNLRFSEPPVKFDIIKHLLPEGSSVELRRLLPGCPLTSTILNLALNELDCKLNDEIECSSKVCFQRQALLIHAHQSKQEQVLRILENFRKNSGITFEIKQHINK